LDEITTTRETQVAHLTPTGNINNYIITPEQLGLPRATPESLQGGDAPFNALIVRRVLAGEKGSARDIVLLNAAAAIHVCQLVPSLQEGLVRAAQVVDQGLAQHKLEQLIHCSNG
ncbi:MAG: anthranilate phosphoribosyltransferase, partial [Magnetococcales bacterium]|nr:anthranilate phosphoribosyltransferase [Magnetococcales bacterium]